MRVPQLQDITVGNPAKAQLARAVRGPEDAFNIMKGNFFVVETKFDGAPPSGPDDMTPLLFCGLVGYGGHRAGLFGCCDMRDID
jgi:hypothetical protein